MSLLDSLGLDDVEADPNFLADGKYAGEVFKSEIVVTNDKKDKDQQNVAHVITYRVTDGPRKSAQKAEWFNLGINPVFSEDAAHTLVSFTSTMTAQAKPWYKKRWTDLGTPEAEVGKADVKTLVGKPVIFGIKTNGEYKNISFVELKVVSGPVSATGGTIPPPNPVQAPAAPVGAL